MNLNLNSNLFRSGGVAGSRGVQSRTINLLLGGAAGTYTGTDTGNWNHAYQNFGSGTIPLTGDSSGQSLASLRTTVGASTGWTVTVPGAGFAGEAVGQATAGLYPLNATRGCWSNASGARSFTISGLTPGKTYIFKILCSVDTVTEGASLIDVTVSGASGGGTFNSFDERGNTSNLLNGANGFTVVPTSGGVVTITTTPNTGHASVSVITIID